LSCWFGEMEKIAEGESDFGDFKAVLFKASDGRHFVRYEPLKADLKPRVEWLCEGDAKEWLRCLFTK
jgi:hypothetical protein